MHRTVCRVSLLAVELHTILSSLPKTNASKHNQINLTQPLTMKLLTPAYLFYIAASVAAADTPASVVANFRTAKLL